MQDRQIPSHPNYTISPTGEVCNTKTGKILTPFKDNRGYKKVNLSKNGSQTPLHIHKLVAEVYIPNPKFLPIVSILNGDKDNCSVANLVWVGRSEAVTTACNSGTMHKRWAPRRVGMYTKDLQLVDTFSSLNEAGKQGYTRQRISLCCNGKADTHAGYIWRYLD
jgi:hypothetical protein